jgi:hypothetical protein
MKHIARKYLKHYTQEEYDGVTKNKKLVPFERGVDDISILNSKNVDFSQPTFLHSENGLIFKGFFHKIKGEKFVFPEPDPTLIYFSAAQSNYRLLEERKKILLPKTKVDSIITEELIHDYFNYFENVCGSIIFLFTSMESFMNSLIPDDFKYEKIESKRTELYNKVQIENNISFDEKISKVIPQIFNLDFRKTHQTYYVHIGNLKEFRDSVIHTKSNVGNFKYDYLVKRSFTFDYLKTIECVAKYMNFYKPDYIAECTCGNDF